MTSMNVAGDLLGSHPLLTDLLTLAPGGLRDGLGEDVADACRLLAEDVCTRTPARSSVVACRWRRSCSRARGSGLAGRVTDLLCRLISLIMSAFTLSGYSGFTPPADEDQTTGVVPGRPGGEPFFGLLAAVLPEDRHGVVLEADRAGPAALGGAFNPSAAHHGGRAAEGDSAASRFTADHRRYGNSPRRAPL
jgi:hypothetical protein